MTVQYKTNRTNRRGWLMAEVLVAFTLIGTLVAVAMPLLVQNNRLLRQQRNHRLAVEELSNQLDRLTHLSPDDLEPLVESLRPSEFIEERLPGAKVTGEIFSEDLGVRIELRINWQGRLAKAQPVVLSGWALPEPNAGPEEEPEGAADEIIPSTEEDQQ